MTAHLFDARSAPIGQKVRDAKTEEVEQRRNGFMYREPHSSALISGTQEPQLVPALRHRPTS